MGQCAKLFLAGGAVIALALYVAILFWLPY